MKKISISFFLLLVSFSLFSQVVFTYGGNAVSKEEFLKAFNKNKPAGNDNDASLKEYLDLYSKFKLKVQAARDMHLDTLEQLRYDVQNFRSQILDSYLNDEKGVGLLVQEAYERSQKDIRITHIYVPLNPKMSPADTSTAYKQIYEAWNMLKKGGKDYNDIANELSAQYKMMMKSADLGFVTVFSLPYDYENIVYKLQKGEFSKPVRSKNAWHIFIKTNERKAFGKWYIAQIFFSVPPHATIEQKSGIERKADSIYKQILSGADFAEMAKKFSDDRFTYMKGGEMPEFGVGKFTPGFEDSIFSLKKDGDISSPVFTGDGYHIVKRLKQTPVVSDKMNETNLYELHQAVLNDNRINIPKQRFIQDAIKKINFKRNAAVSDSLLFLYADGVTAEDKPIETPINEAVVFSVKNENTHGIDWLNFVKSNKQQFGDRIPGNKELLEKFTSNSVMDFYKRNLEEYNSDFKYQVLEFKEGNMLFEIMERNVWNKAANDSTGLISHYNKNKSNYLWGPSAEAVIFNCSSQRVAEDAVKNLKEGKPWASIAQQSEARIQADSGRYEISQLQVPENVNLFEGYISEVTVNSNDNTASFFKIVKIYPANQQRNFEDARGLVINDYQNFLETNWVEELKKKYPVVVNKKVFESLLKTK